MNKSRLRTMGRGSAGAEALCQVEASSAPTPSLGPWNKAAVGVAGVPFTHSFFRPAWGSSSGSSRYTGNLNSESVETLAWEPVNRARKH